MKYAFENSKFINQTSIIIKISGRYQIKNINFLVFWISKIRKKNTSFVATDVIYSARFATSGCIIASKDFYENYFIPCITEINDSKKRYFEHVLFDTIKTWMKEKKYFIQYPFPVKKYGVSGTTGEMVNSLNFMRYPVTFLKFVLIQTRVKKL